MANISEENLKHRLCRSMYAGQRSMAEGIINIIRQCAGSSYAEGQDIEAAAFRTLASSLEKNVLEPAREKCIAWEKEFEEEV
jgi:hypothetical protein